MNTQSEQRFDDLLVRPMLAEDIPTILEIDRETQGAPHWSAQVYQNCVENSASKLQRRARIALSGGQILGFIVASGVTVENVAEWELESVVVRPNHQRHGVGERLISALIFEIKTAGATALLLEVRASNEAAVRLYERLGMSKVGTRKGYYGGLSGSEPENALLMHLKF